MEFDVNACLSTQFLSTTMKKLHPTPTDKLIFIIAASLYQINSTKGLVVGSISVFGQNILAPPFQFSWLLELLHVQTFFIAQIIITPDHLLYSSPRSKLRFLNIINVMNVLEHCLKMFSSFLKMSLVWTWKAVIIFFTFLNLYVFVIIAGT